MFCGARSSNRVHGRVDTQDKNGIDFVYYCFLDELRYSILVVFNQELGNVDHLGGLVA